MGVKHLFTRPKCAYLRDMLGRTWWTLMNIAREVPRKWE